MNGYPLDSVRPAKTQNKKAPHNRGKLFNVDVNSD